MTARHLLASFFSVKKRSNLYSILKLYCSYQLSLDFYSSLIEKDTTGGWMTHCWRR